jgi:hypothetical protein
MPHHHGSTQPCASAGPIQSGKGPVWFAYKPVVQAFGVDIVTDSRADIVDVVGEGALPLARPSPGGIEDRDATPHVADKAVRYRNGVDAVPCDFVANVGGRGKGPSRYGVGNCKSADRQAE